MDKIINELKNLGLTEYESKAYLALLKEYPQNGYTLSKNSGIPRSRIYEVLDGLTKKQIVFEYEKEKATVYTPLEPKLLMEKLRVDFESVITSVDNYTTDLFQHSELSEEDKTLFGNDKIIEMIKLLIGEAKERISLSIWDEELIHINDVLKTAQDRGIMVRGIYFGSHNPIEELVSHRRIQRYIAEKEERYIIVIIDNKHLISGVVSRGTDSKATWSSDSSVIDISNDFIAHDVMLNTYYYSLEGDSQISYENSLDQVRKDYYGFSDEQYSSFPLPSA